jgi:hypothetical protein
MTTAQSADHSTARSASFEMLGNVFTCVCTGGGGEGGDVEVVGVGRVVMWARGEWVVRPKPRHMRHGDDLMCVWERERVRVFVYVVCVCVRVRTHM